MSHSKETANILIQYMPNTCYDIHDFIVSGNLEVLLTAIRNTANRTTIVIIEHDPYLSMWVNP